LNCSVWSRAESVSSMSRMSITARTHGWRDPRKIRERVRAVMDDVGLPVALYGSLNCSVWSRAESVSSMSRI
jgi:hypothetical protein